MSAATLEEGWHDRVDPRIIAGLRPIARALRALHEARVEGIAHLPRGPALLVGNHGLLGYETIVFFERLLELTGRLPRGLADRWFFRVPVLRDVLVRAGGMLGSMENARRALARGDWVVCYPGGAREVLKRDRRQKYRLLWQQSRGFVRLAAEMHVPLVPFAAAGVDDTFDVIATLRGTGKMLMGHPKYDLPVLWGRGPVPRPVPFWFRFGAPLRVDALWGDRDVIAAFHARIWAATQKLLDGLVAEWMAAYKGSTR